MAPPTADDAFTFLPQGALIQEFRVAGHNIVQGFTNPEHYRTHNGPYYGETIGRVANRISNAKIESLNGQSYTIAANNGKNSLHGGNLGWGKKDFVGPTPGLRNGKESVKFVYSSPHMDEGYPGSVELRVWYTASKVTEDGVEKTVLESEYEVEMTGDEVEETLVAVTNHSYFNVAPGPSIEGTEATLGTNLYLPIDDGGIPTAGPSPYPGIEANKPFILGPKEPDIDDCFVIDDQPSGIPLDTRSRPLKLVAKLSHPTTGLHLEVTSTEPAFQFYTGKFIDVPAVGADAARGPRTGIAIEPSRYVNAANTEAWKGMVLLRKGQLWGSKMVYKAWKA